MKTVRIPPKIAEAWNRLAAQAWERLAADIVSQAETSSSPADDAEAIKALTEYLKMAGETDTVQEKAASENFVRAEISTVRAEISDVRAEIRAVEVRLVRWMIGTGVALFAALKWIP